jgi:hypothetical protein
MKGYYKSLSHINTASVPVALRIDIPTHMEPSFMEVLDQEHCHVLPAETIFL